MLLAIVIFLPYISRFFKWFRNKAIGKNQILTVTDMNLNTDSFKSNSFRLVKMPTRFLLRVSGQVEESPDYMLFYTFLPNEPLSKERVEAFSDGVYAIVATLLILDIWFVPLSVLLYVLYVCDNKCSHTPT